MSDLAIVILAAGKGTRMHSAKPKVLHSLAGRPWILQLVESTQALNPQNIYIVVSPENRGAIELSLTSYNCQFIEQAQTLGTAHAVKEALPFIQAEKTMVILGDTPLLKTETLKHLLKIPQNNLGMLSFMPEDPTGLGRIIRDTRNEILRVVEEKDASESEKVIRESVVGTFIAPTSMLAFLLPQIRNDNAAKEYYLPDLIPLALQAKHGVSVIKMNDPIEGWGINTKNQLAIAERYFQRQQVTQLMGLGVTIMDPERIDIRGKLTVHADVTLDINVIIEGEVHIGEGCLIGAHSVLRNVHIGNNVHVKPYSMIEDAVIEAGCTIGPFARIRPGCHLHENVQVGNFVELKKTNLGSNSKVNHLSYVGDAQIGSGVNIGAGTITCNYDGVNKHATIIKDGAFIGSNTALIAPITVGERAVIGAGTVLTKDAPDEQLTVGRPKQISIANWRNEEK